MKKLLTMMFVAAVILSMVVLPVSAEGQEIVNVSTVEQLKNAIASDTKIILAPGKYVFEAEVIKEVYDGVEYEFKDPTMLRIEGINNLSIEGNGQAEIVLDYGAAPVAFIINSTAIELSGLIMGHDVPEYGCEGEGYVVQIADSKDIAINNCDLYGCGVTGIYSWSAENVYVNKSIIRECMINAVTLIDHRGNAVFSECKFNGNAYDEWYAKSTPCIEISKNEENPDGVELSFINCSFENNLSKQFLSHGANAWVDTDSCTFYNNVWQNAINVKSFRYDYWTTHVFEDQEPVIVEGRTLVPLRGVLANLGYHIDWNDEQQAAIIRKSGVPYEVTVKIGSNQIQKGSEVIEIDVPATIINDRTMVPIRAISEAFDMKVEWEDATRSVLLYPDE